MRRAGLLALALAGACAAGEVPSTHSEQTLEGFMDGGGVRLAYRLDLPSGKPPFPAIVVGHGSGRVTRAAGDPIARELLNRGFAVLRYDKRGVGESDGTYSSVGAVSSDTLIPQLAADMAAGVAFLRTRRDIDVRRIGLAGVSQAGWIIPVAAERSGAAFALILVGSTMPIGRNIYYERLNRETADPPALLAERVREYDGPLGFDPIPVLERLEIPVYWVFAGEDRNVPTPLCLARIDSLRSRRPKDYTIEVFPDAGHAAPFTHPIWSGIDSWLVRVRR